MEMFIHPLFKPLVMSGQKTSNLCHGQVEKEIGVDFLTEVTPEHWEFFGKALLRSCTPVRVMPTRKHVLFFVNNQWQRATAPAIKELIKSEGLPNEGNFWARFPRSWTGTRVQWEAYQACLPRTYEKEKFNFSNTH